MKTVIIMGEEGSYDTYQEFVDSVLTHEDDSISIIALEKEYSELSAKFQTDYDTLKKTIPRKERGGSEVLMDYMAKRPFRSLKEYLLSKGFVEIKFETVSW